MSSWSEAGHRTASFLAVVPPDDVVEEVRRLQQRCGVTPAVLPHITVKAQPGLEDHDCWAPSVRKVLAAAPGFAVKLGPVGTFGHDIVFLQVHGPGVVAVHRAILGALEEAGIPERFEYDGDAYVPHLTLAAAFAGATREQLDLMIAAAIRVAWPPFDVTEVVELHRASPSAPYVPRDRFPLRSAG